jgi:predicted nucleic acid-binding protein
LTPVVLDAGAALYVLAAADPRPLPLELHAPRLLRSEVLSALHAQVWRGVVPPEAARAMLLGLNGLRLALFADEHLLHDRAWNIATDLGWAKTYDAEYVALAQILGIPLLTADLRLARAVGHLIGITSPAAAGL